MARVLIALTPLISGCAALKTGGVAGISAGVGGLVGGPAGAAAGAAVGAGATSLLTTDGGQCGSSITGFWPMVGAVIETGGWLLAGIVLIPLVMGYLIPNGFVKQKNI
jgi:hypothetical protein